MKWAALITLAIAPIRTIEDDCFKVHIYIKMVMTIVATNPAIMALSQFIIYFLIGLVLALFSDQ